MYTRTLFCLLLASCATVPLEEEQAPPKNQVLASPAKSLFGHYDIFNSLSMKTHQYGVVEEGNYYWGTIEIKADKRVLFYVDSKLQEDHIYQFPDPPKKTFPTFGTIPSDGNLSYVYFYTPKESGYLFSGSIRKGSGMTSLLPKYYAQRFVHVRFVKRDPAQR